MLQATQRTMRGFRNMIVLATAVSGGCASTPGGVAPAPVSGAAAAPAPAAPPAPPPRVLPEARVLIGTRWVLVEAAGAPVGPGIGGALPWVEFGSEGFGGHSGCNNYGTQYRVEGRRFVTQGIEANMMACAPPVGPTEERLYRALGGPFDFDIEADGRLVILKDGEAALRFARVPPTTPLAARPEPAALVGTRWRLIEADGVRVADDPAYQMVTFDMGDRSFNGSSGCNGYSASYRMQDRRFVPTPPMATQRGCGPPVGTLERRLFQILGAPFEVDTDAEGRLVILSGGVPVLRFVGR